MKKYHFFLVIVFISTQVSSQYLDNFLEYYNGIYNFKDSFSRIDKVESCNNDFFLALKEYRYNLKQKADSIINVVKINNTKPNKFCYISAKEFWIKKKKSLKYINEGLKYVKDKKHRYFELELYCNCIDSLKIDYKIQDLYFTQIRKIR